MATKPTKYLGKNTTKMCETLMEKVLRDIKIMRRDVCVYEWKIYYHKDVSFLLLTDSLSFQLKSPSR